MITGARYGTQAWHDQRRGLVTASRFGDVLTEPRSKAAKEAGEMSDTARSYLMELVAATITGQDKVGGKSAAMERGIDKEADAINAYCQERFLFPEDWSEGCILRLDDTLIAATPDAFIETDTEGPGILEVKCPDSMRHLDTFFSRQVPEQYHEQVLGQLEVSGRQWCDFVSFDDRFPKAMQLVIIRVYPSPQFGAESMPKIAHFADLVQQRVDDVRAFLAGTSPHAAAAVVSAMTSTEDPANLFAGL